MIPVMTFVFVLLFLIIHSSNASSEERHIKTASGHQIPLSLVRKHLPSTTRMNRIPSLLYEHNIITSDLKSLSLHETLRPTTLAPKIIPSTTSETRYVINDIPYTFAKSPIMRISDSYTFVYDHASGVLLAGWGPSLNLVPLHLKTHPTILVNIHNDAMPMHVQGISRAETPVSVTENRYKPSFRAEREVFFDVGLAFDSSFCHIYGDDGPNATQVAHVTGVRAHSMSLTPIVSLRIMAVIGYCNSAQSFSGTKTVNKKSVVVSSTSVKADGFQLQQEKIDNCYKDPSCSPQKMILDNFAEAWRSIASKDYKTDCAYLLTQPSKPPPDNVYGAAWTESICTDYAVGYSFGNYPIILAHEMGHTLGAPHFKSGLMRSHLRLSEKSQSQYAPASLIDMDNFIAKLLGQNCLEARHQGKGQERRFKGFTQLVRPHDTNELIEGTDVAVGSVHRHGEASVAMMHARRFIRGQVGFQVRVTTLFRSVEPGFPFTYNNSFTKVGVKKGHLADISAGGAVAITDLEKIDQDDLIAVMIRKKDNRIFYIVGYNLLPNIDTVINGGWSRGAVVNIDLGGKIIALGATAGDMRRVGQKDLIVTYVVEIEAPGETGVPMNLNSTTSGKSTILRVRYVIGYNINGNNAVPQGGWSKPVDVPYPSSILSSIKDIGDVSVAIWNIPPADESSLTETTNLLFSLTHNTSPDSYIWRNTALVAESAHLLKRSNSNPTAFKIIPTRVKTLRGIKRVTGGIALTRMLSATSPVVTSVIYQSRTYANGEATLWLHVGDGILTKEKAVDLGAPEELALTLGEYVVPSSVCTQCYNGNNNVDICEKAVHACFTDRNIGQLDVLFASSKQQNAVNVPITPKNTIFCAGFHSIFVRRYSLNEKCEWDATRTSIIAEGLRVILLSGLSPTAPVNSEVSITNTNTNGNDKLKELAQILAIGANGKPIPNTAVVHVNFPKYDYHRIIKQAHRLLQTKQDFKSFFSKTQKTVVKKVGNKKYRVVFKFNQKYQFVFVTDTAKSIS